MNTVADMIDDDISSCLKEMTEQIDELQELRILAATARFLDMTEEEYHKLCETPLRHTDTLGILLGEKLKCIYDKGTPNAFCYLFSDGTRLRIPSSRVHGAEIILSKIYKENYRDEGTYDACLLWLEDVREKIHGIENGFLKSGYFGRVKFCFEKRYRRNVLGYVLMFAEYTAKNLRRNYSKRYAEILEDLKEQECKAEQKLQELEAEYKGKYEEQRKAIKGYCKQLFEWTDTVRIYQSGSDYIAETIERK